MKDNTCYKEAFRGIADACVSPDAERLAKIGFDLMNCLVKELQKPSYPCNAEESQAACLRPVKGADWETYLQFYTHLSHICDYPKFTLWKERNEHLINQLVQSFEDNIILLTNTKTILTDLDADSQTILVYLDQKNEDMNKIENLAADLGGKILILKSQIDERRKENVHSWMDWLFYPIYLAAIFVFIQFETFEPSSGLLKAVGIFACVLELTIRSTVEYDLKYLFYLLRSTLVLYSCKLLYSDYNQIIVKNKDVMAQVINLKQRTKDAGINTPVFKDMVHHLFAETIKNANGGPVIQNVVGQGHQVEARNNPVGPKDAFTLAWAKFKENPRWEELKGMAEAIKKKN